MGGNLTYAATVKAMEDVIKKQSYEALLGLGWELVIAFFIGGALLTAIMTPITYVLVKRLVVMFQNRKKSQIVS